jgi:hypothetical protein
MFELWYEHTDFFSSTVVMKHTSSHSRNNSRYIKLNIQKKKLEADGLFQVSYIQVVRCTI